MKKLLVIIALLFIMACKKDEPDKYCWKCFEASLNDTTGLPENMIRYDTCNMTFDEIEAMIGHKYGAPFDTMLWYNGGIVKDCSIIR
jgi:hypothetical protein